MGSKLLILGSLEALSKCNFLTIFWSQVHAPIPHIHINITVPFILANLLARDRKSFPKILGSMLKYFRQLGTNCITFRDLGNSSKIVLGSTRKYFKGAGGIWALLSTYPHPIPPPRGPHLNLFSTLVRMYRKRR